MGPPAVGKMAVGLELSKILGYKLFLNHDSIELALKFFEYGSEKFVIINEGIRERIFEEVASSDLPGLIFTYVPAMNDVSEKVYIEKIINKFSKYNKESYFVELEAELSVRLQRNKEKSRIDAKPSKSDIRLSEKGLLSMEQKYVMNSNEEYPFFFDKNNLKINNTTLSPKEVALQIITEFKLLEKRKKKISE